MQVAKVEYERNLVSQFSLNKKKLYGYLKSLSKSAHQPLFIMDNDIPVRDHVKIAELFNSFFNSTFTKSDYSLPPVEYLPTPTNQLSNIEFSPQDVYRALVDLNPSKAMGHDGISPSVLNFCANSLVYPIYNLFKQCLLSQTIPNEWKIHKICPIHKKKDKLDIKNYRPISLLCVISKVLESVIYDRFYSSSFIKISIWIPQKSFMLIATTYLLLKYITISR